MTIKPFNDAEIHARHSIRLSGYDYSSPGAYFITICTHQYKCRFGEIVDENMRLNEYGKIVQDVWSQIPSHFSHVTLSEFVIMPNHIHGIIIINESVGVRHAEPLPQYEKYGKPTNGTILTIIRSFKSETTKQIHLHQQNKIPVWQRNYLGTHHPG